MTAYIPFSEHSSGVPTPGKCSVNFTYNGTFWHLSNATGKWTRACINIIFYSSGNCTDYTDVPVQLSNSREISEYFLNVTRQHCSKQ
jgi:hypothetical protein